MSVTITGLALDHFRAHTSLCLTLTNPHIVITGPNGSGKTNILEACSLLSPGRGLHHKTAESMLNHNNKDQPWRITADICTHTSSPLIISYSKGKISRHLAHNPLSHTDLTTLLGVWWHTPLIDHLFTTPSARRQFLDRCASRIHPKHLYHLSAYKHFMHERLKALSAPSSNTTLLDTLENHMVSSAHTITLNRFSTLDALSPFLKEPPLPQTKIQIEALSKPEKLWLDNPKDMDSYLHTSLKKDRERDRLHKRTHSGVHNAALSFLLVKQDRTIPYELCSTGQRKLCSLSIVLASVQHHRAFHPTLPALLLLDETLTHMDPHTCTHLTQYLQTLNAQTWCTSCDDATKAYFPNGQHFLLTSTHTLEP